MKKIFTLIIISLFALNISAQDITTFPYFTGFEGVAGTLNDNFPQDWTYEDLNQIQFGNQSWQIIKNSTTSVNANTDSTAVHTYSHASETNNDWLYTPSIQMYNGKTYTLKFWYKTKRFGSTFEKLKVHIGDSNTSTNMITTAAILDLDSITNEVYREAVVTYTPTQNEVKFFAFYSYSDAFMFLLLIDDITIIEDNCNGIEEANTKNYTYINTNDNHNIAFELNNSSFVNTSYSIYNTAGQIVKTSNIDNNTNRVDISIDFLSSGQYFVIINENTGRKLYSETFIVK